MLAPAFHDEEERLKELSNYAVLDTPPEPALDHITRLAARVFEMPAAFLSILDRHRQRYQSLYGIALQECSRDQSFCAHTILSDEPMVVPDALLDPRFADSPPVRGEPFIRFYAGMPLKTRRGHRIGTLCVIDFEPREFSAEQAGILAEMTGLAMRELELRRNVVRTSIELERRKHADLSMRATRDELEARIEQRTTALVEAEARYRGIFENAAEGMYQFRPGEGFLSANPAFAHLLGYSSPEALLAAVADPARHYVHPQEHAEFYRRLADTGDAAQMESEIYRTDGSRIWICENAHVVRDGTGNLVRYEGTVVDITARRTAEEALRRAHEELEDRVRERTAELALLNGDLRLQIIERENAEANAHRSESKFRALIENAQDLISIFSSDGLIVYKSPSVEHILGYKPEELVGQSIFDGHLHPDDYERVRRYLQGALKPGGSYQRTECRVRHRDGSWRLLENISSALPPDSPLRGVVINSRDITDRHRNEQEALARSREHSAIAELGRDALQGLDLPTIFDHTAELVARALEVDLTSINELLPEGKQLLMRAGVGWQEGVVGRMTVDHWRSHLAEDEETEERPLLVEDLRAAACYPVLPPEVLGVKPVSAVSAVIHCGGKPYGTLCALTTRPRQFDAQETVFLQTVADLLSTLIESRRHEAASREVETRYQRIAANTPGMVYQAIRHPDGTGTILFVSEGCRQLYGLDPAQIRVNPNLFNEAIHPDDRPSVFAALDASNANLAPLQWEGRLVQPSGEVRWVTVRSRPELLPNGDIFRDGLVLDVTELKHAQEAMRAAKEEAEKANRTKSEFLSRMSHELRTPLNAILGFGQLLELEELPPTQSSCVEQILRGGKHLLDLVNEVLDITRIEAGGMDLVPETIDAHAALAAVARFVKPLAGQHQVRIGHRHPRRSIFVRADRGRLNQVLLNLLSNAIKYNRPAGRVRLACHALDEQTARINITDDGPGMTPEEISRLFTPFQRLNAPERGIDGTGIGLTISRSLVEAMGGSIGVDSVSGQGSTFYVDLPRFSPGGAPPGDNVAQDLQGVTEAGLADDPPPAKPAVRTILHIDDQAANLSLLERILGSRPDLQLLSAADAHAGLALAREHRPDLILLDLHLPDLGGDEVMRRLHNAPRTHGIPVLVLSADATPAQIQRLRSLGACDYVTKPFKIQTLLRAINQVLDPSAA